MRALIQAVADRIIGMVEEVSADRILVRLEPEAPQATALNAGTPAGFPRINGYVLIPHEGGAVACIISSVRIERLRFPKRTGMQQDFGLVYLPFPSRVMSLTPIGTLTARRAGESLSFRVHRGVDVFPSVGDPVLLPSAVQLQAIVEGEGDAAGRIRLGHCPTAGRAPVHVDPDKLFGRHLAVLGNTGAGKSCSVAGLVRWSLEAAQQARIASERDCKPNARFIVLDPNGEYARAFGDCRVRLFRVDPRAEAKALRVPAWLWNGAEWAAFTGAAPGAQRPVLFEALRRLRSGLGVPGEFETEARGRIKRYRNRLDVLIQSGDHQKTGRREGVAQVLFNIHEDFQELVGRSACVDTALRDRLDWVASKAEEVETAARGNPKAGGGWWHHDFSETALGTITKALREAGDAAGLEDGLSATDEDTPIPFLVRELPDYVDALAADHAGRDIAQFVDTLNLRIRSLLSAGRLASVIQPDDSTSTTLEGWLTDYVGADQADNGPLAVIDLSLVPSEVIHVVVSVLGRMVFEALQRHRREKGQELPTTLILEEAHTFVQRPSEVSPTVLSQCNTFLLHRLVNDRDQELVKRLVPDGLGPLLRELPSLPTRRAILLGWAAPAPTLVEIGEVPEEYRPHSPDPAFWDVWTGEEERAINWSAIVKTWQGGEEVAE